MRMTDVSSKKCFECDVNLPVFNSRTPNFQFETVYKKSLSSLKLNADILMMSAPVSHSQLFLLVHSIFLYSHFSNSKITSASAEHVKSEQVDAAHLGPTALRWHIPSRPDDDVSVSAVT